MIEAPLQSTIPNAWSSIDAFAAAIILAGILCQFLRRHMPAGLGTSLFIGATTVGAITAAIAHDWPAAGEIYILTRIASLLCGLWAFFGWLASRSMRRMPSSTTIRAATVRERSSKEALTEHDRSLTVAALISADRSLTAAALNSTGEATAPSDTPSGDPSHTFFAWSLVTGVVVAVLTAYVLFYATASRLINPRETIERLTAAGLWNIIALLTAALFWTMAAARRRQPVLSLALAALLVWWTSLMIPSAVGTYQGTASVLLPFQPVWWTWTFQLQLGLAVLLLVAAVLQEVGYRTRRARAWPDRLDDLLEPYSRWPAYTQTESVIAAGILVVGVFQIVRPGPPSWPLALANCSVSLVVGATCMFMAYRRWSPNTAGLGMALLTLAAVALACAVAPVFSSLDENAEYAARLPVVLNGVLLAMAAMIGLWSWLARFWDQQLLDGIAWTTTGRMIPYAKRTAYLLTALACLVGVQMALWPRRVLPSVEDNTPGRLVAGVLALTLLAVIASRNARRADSSAGATLGLTFMATALIFVFVRMPAPSLRGWLTQHIAVVFSGLALPVLVLGGVLARTRFRCFAEPLWWLALLVLPAGALAELLVSRLPADWIRPAVLAILGVLYVIAGSRERRRSLSLLGGVLLLAALITLYRAYGPR